MASQRHRGFCGGAAAQTPTTSQRTANTSGKQRVASFCEKMREWLVDTADVVTQTGPEGVAVSDFLLPGLLCFTTLRSR